MAYAYTNTKRENEGCGTSYEWSGGFGRDRRRAADVGQAIQPLVERIREYDSIRLKLEREGGYISDFSRVTQLLSQPFMIKGINRNCPAALTDQNSLRTALYEAGGDDYHLDVRQLSTRMPVYYLCRIRRDYWSEYSLIVEDVYQSTGYPMVDDRFVRLMDGGHEAYYLRLSQFREGVKIAGSNTGSMSELETDDLLYRLGRHIFQAAWHEDQRLGVLTALHFGLTHFREAIELLYLCLSGELCEMRSATNHRVLSFFEEIYPQPAIRAFLKMLCELDGATINDLPRRALKLYVRLSAAFSRFLSVEICWGHQKATITLYKLVFGNFSRLPLIAAQIKEDSCIRSAALRLEQEAFMIVGEVVREHMMPTVSIPDGTRGGES